MILNATHREQLVQFLDLVGRGPQKFLDDPRLSALGDLPTTSSIKINNEIAVEVVCVAPNRYMLHAGGRMNRAGEVTKGYAWISLELRYHNRTVNTTYVDLARDDNLVHALMHALRSLCMDCKALPPGALGLEGERRLETFLREGGPV